MKKITWKKVWRFLWDDDSIYSWIANLVIAFVIIRYAVYPLLAIALGTSFPIVAVVSESMEHGLHNGVICGNSLDVYKESFDNYWDVCGYWYEGRNVTKEQFLTFPMRDGFNKGDVIILWRPTELEVGDVLIFQAHRIQPIIHRIVRVWQENGKTYYQTKGDHNAQSVGSQVGEDKIHESRIYGKAALRVPYLGYFKIIFVELVKPLGIVIDR